MNARKPLFWQQGLFLQPQHFQYADRHFEQALSDRQALAQPHPWGIVALELAAGPLANAVAEVQSAALVFPDGTFVQVPDNAVLPSRSFASAWADKNRAFRLYVGVKKLAASEPNVTVVEQSGDAQGVKTRYLAYTDNPQVPDVHQGGGSEALGVLDHALVFLWEDELEDASDYVTMPVAQVLMDGDAIAADPDYAAPSLTLESSPTLVQRLKSVRDGLHSRARQLEDYKSAAEGSGENTSPKFTRYLLALQMLGRYLPELIHYLETPALHPWHAYKALRQLVGEVSVFSTRADVTGERADGGPGLPSYDHQELGACFKAAHELIEQMLNEITVGAEAIVRLEASDADRYTAEVPPAFFERGSEHYLVLRTAEPFDELLDSFVHFAKLGAASAVDVYAARALPGVGVEHLQVRPEGLPYRPRANYLRLERESEAWEDVEREGRLALLWNDAPEDLSVELVVLRR